MKQPAQETWFAGVLVVLCVFFGCAKDAHQGPEHEDAHEDEHEDEHVGEHNEHQEDEHEDHVVEIDEEHLSELGLTLAVAEAGELHREVLLPGEVRMNPDLVAHVTPRTPGIAREVLKTIGDRVAAGDLLAVLDSRELATAKAEFLGTKEKLSLAIATLRREELLREKRISSEKDYLDARQKKAEAEIDLHSAEQRLRALGLTAERLRALEEASESDLTRYEMHAPIAGEIVEKHITRGELLNEQDAAFVVANLESVWVLLTVYQKDLPLVEVGQEVVVETSGNGPQARGRIEYVSPLLSEETRAASARIVLQNRNGIWRPGLFVTGHIQVGTSKAPIVVPRSALQTVEGHSVVFVKTELGFVPREVETGLSDGEHVELVSGLKLGEIYVASGGFSLKAELQKGTFGDGHQH